MRQKTKQVAFVFDWIGGITCWSRASTNGGPLVERPSGGITCGTVYEDEIEFADDFARAFPGRKDTLSNVSSRLRRLLKTMYDDGWLDRSVRPNYKEYMGEAGNWSYSYALPFRIAKAFREGKKTPEDFARQYCGDQS